MQMTAGLDCGPVYSSRSVLIEDGESAGELHDRLAPLGGELLIESFDAVIKGTILPIEQDQAAATYAKKIQKQDAEIDWSLPADELHRHIRAYNPAPGAFFFAEGSLRIKVWKSEYVADIEAEPGTFVQYDSSGIVVACGQGGLRLVELQLPGKRRAPFREFISQIDLR